MVCVAGSLMAKRAAGADRMVVLSPSLDEHLYLLQFIDDLAVHQLVHEDGAGSRWCGHRHEWLQ